MHHVFFFTSRRNICCQKLNATSLCISTVQTCKDAGLILRLCPWSPPVVSPVVERGHRGSFDKMCLLLPPPPPPPPPPEFHPPARKSQSGDFDDVDSSWAGRGLDARSGWAARRRRHPALPLWQPVETIAVRSQSGRRREADDGRGDASAFTVDPVAVVSFQIEVWTAVKKKGETNVTEEVSVIWRVK